MSFWKSWTAVVVIWIQITPEWTIQLLTLRLFVQETGSLDPDPNNLKWMCLDVWFVILSEIHSGKKNKNNLTLCKLHKICHRVALTIKNKMQTILRLMSLDDGEQEMCVFCGWVTRLFGSSGERSCIPTGLPADWRLHSRALFAGTLHHLSGQSSQSPGRLLTQVCKKLYLKKKNIYIYITKKKARDTLCYVTQLYRRAGETRSDASLRGRSLLSHLKKVTLEKHISVSSVRDSPAIQQWLTL